jgi:serine protease AprX
VEPVEPPAQLEPPAPAAPVASEPAGVEAEPSTSLADLNALVGADALHARGITGAGVDVALIDTGVTPVEGLHGPKVVYGPTCPSTACRTRRGTWTATATARAWPPSSPATTDRPATASPPEPRLVSVKVGAADGTVDVSQIIAAIDWVVQHRRSDGLNIRS